MTKLGWGILSVFLLIVAAFAATTRFGTADRTRGGDRPVAEPPVGEEGQAGTLAIPVRGVTEAALQDSWNDARGGGTRGHHGTDIMAAGGTPVTAAAPGRVEKLFESSLGGTTLYVRSPDRRWIYYYAHLAGYAPGVHEGQTVRTGDPLGFVGDSGDAGPGHYHLHFGVQRMQPGERWWEGQDVNPYPLLAGKPASR
ncbi:murein DD-endopeptidase MepM/ murein hydrolase activator NlpD [Sphingomonas jinjuensis]|uniref:Murein DD-endopeptidase MepM/ murein hydrolase activator NlpD n=1 Tax=Sphingomonas jinjuensis TaxID=535907 RepID=A0A840FPN1_9SPHN|nr:M23 family metallopeptidase [Sphingomonas jinjuensis]MBB4155235.1 murein DD-endopeptidase MepM/ murein hydrolase activator NlpD [Sphingomonas jinjuensis]